jgi:2-methylcitrate dehydratase PrpD
MTVHARGPDAVVELSQFIAGLQFDRIPPKVTTLTTWALLDTLGVALAGSGLGEGCHEVVEFATAQAGLPEATVWANGIRVPAPGAALANGALARALDYDDLVERPPGHLAVCVVPAALAVAERAHAPVSGKALLTAIVAGEELQCRLGAAVAASQPPGVFPVMLSTQLFGYFSAAAASARLLHLSAEQTESALGLALMQASGTEELIIHSAASVGKAIYAGFSNQGGVQAALLAERGVTARGEILEGQAGLFAAYYGGRYSRAALTEGLGERFLSHDRLFKCWPGSAVTHPFLEAALELRHAHQLVPSRIADVLVRVGVWGRAMCEPAEARREPASAGIAKNSIPFVVAKALVNGGIELQDFEAPRLGQPEVLALAARIVHQFDPALGGGAGLEPGMVEIRLTDGSSHAARVDQARGHPDRPLSFDELVGKFRRNAGLARTPLKPDQVERIVERVHRLEALEDVRPLTRCLAGEADGRHA